MGRLRGVSSVSFVGRDSTSTPRILTCTGRCIGCRRRLRLYYGIKIKSLVVKGNSTMEVYYD